MGPQFPRAGNCPIAGSGGGLLRVVGGRERAHRQLEITHGRAHGAAAYVLPDESARPKRRRCVLGAVGRFQDETSALIKETAKNAPPNSVSPTATTRQTTQPMSSRLDNPSNMRHHGIGRDSNIICVVFSQRKKVHRLSPCNAESVTARAMNRTAPEGGQGLLFVPRRGAPS
jgi:hypothetical protein